MSSTWPLIAIIIVLLLLYAWREYRHEMERKDLYSRLMAKDYQEYKAFDHEKRPPPVQRNFLRAGVERYYNQKSGD